MIYESKKSAILQVDVKISLPDGSSISYDQIKVGDEILTVDDNNQLCTTIVSDISEVPFKINEKLKFQVKRSGSGNLGRHCVICADPNLLIYDFDKKDFISAKSFIIDNHVLMHKKNLELSFVQKSILNGIMLGDASLHSVNHSAAVYWSHVEYDKLYCEWIAQGLTDIYLKSSERVITSGFGSKMHCASTCFLSSIKEKYDLWFLNKKKIVPESIIDEINPLTMAFWYMDDGCRNHNTSFYQEDRVTFSTCGFSENDCKILIKSLEKFGMIPSFKIFDGYNYLCLNTDDSEKFFVYVAPYIPPVMQRKLPDRYKGSPGWIPSKILGEYRSKLIPQIVSDISFSDKQISNHTNSYFKITTESGKFFANTILVKGIEND